MSQHPKVFLDAGHQLTGGNDSGAIGNGIKEKDRALTYTLEIGKELSRHGVKVGYSRTTDVFVELHERANKANHVGADVFVAIHLNSFPKPSVRGFEIYHFPGSAEGLALCKDIHRQVINDKLYTLDRGIKSANFAVLRRTRMKSCLVELGFISNAEDVNLLGNKQDEMVRSITKGILKNLGIKYIEKAKKESDKVKINYKGKAIEVDGKLIEGTNYVSVREVFEELGHKVDWDNKYNSVIIK